MDPSFEDYSDQATSWLLGLLSVNEKSRDDTNRFCGTREEATAPCLRKPVLVIRLSTERQEAVQAGLARVVGREGERILEPMKSLSKMERIYLQHLLTEMEVLLKESLK